MDPSSDDESILIVNKWNKKVSDIHYVPLKYRRQNIDKTLRKLQECRNHLLQWSSDKWPDVSNLWSLENDSIKKEMLTADTSSEYVEKIESIITEQGLQPNQIYYLDEVKLHSMLPKKDKMARREYVRVLLCANVTGEHKMALSVVGRFKKTQDLSNRFYSHRQKSTILPAVTFRAWFLNCFAHDAREFLNEINLPPQAVLLTSRPRGVYETKCGSFCTMYLPTNMTTMVKEMYLTLRSVYAMEIRLLLDKIAADDKGTIMSTAIRAWDNLTQNDIHRVFKKIISFEDGKVTLKRVAVEIATPDAAPAQLSVREEAAENVSKDDESIEDLVSSIDDTHKLLLAELDAEYESDDFQFILKDLAQDAGSSVAKNKTEDENQPATEGENKRKTSDVTDDDDAKKQRIEINNQQE